MIGAAVLFSTGGATIECTGFLVCLPAAVPATGDGGDWLLILGATAVKVLSDARRGGEPTAVEAAARAAPP